MIEVLQKHLNYLLVKIWCPQNWNNTIAPMPDIGPQFPGQIREKRKLHPLTAKLFASEGGDCFVFYISVLDHSEFPFVFLLGH